MSGTRLLSRKAPVTECDTGPSLLIAAHGECGGSGENHLPFALAKAVREHGDFAAVKVGFIRAEPLVEHVGRNLPEGPVRVFPLFMSNGYYVRQAIPERLGIGSDGLDRLKRPVSILQPIGLSETIPAIIADLAVETARNADFRIDDTTLLLVAHGSSKDPASRNATMSVATTLGEVRQFRSIEIAYLEESPFLEDQLKSIPGPVVAAGLFIGEGMHGKEDLPQAVDECGRKDIVITPALARSPVLIENLWNELCAPVHEAV